MSCRALGVSPGWFYQWRRGDGSLRRKRRVALAALIRYLFDNHHGAYGSPRITADLRELGWRVSKNTVVRLMGEQQLVARPRRRRRSLTKTDRSARKAPDALGRDFRPPLEPNLRWCGDLTEIPTEEGKLYLATVLDLASRRLAGFALGEHHDSALAKAALCVAAAVRGGDIDGVIFHSDKGGEYVGDLFARACDVLGVTQSMGRVGSALDNAAAESWNSTLEHELLSRRRFETKDGARRAVARFIDAYNHRRRHSSCEMLPPVAYEQRLAERAAAETPRTG